MFMVAGDGGDYCVTMLIGIHVDKTELRRRSTLRECAKTERINDYGKIPVIFLICWNLCPLQSISMRMDQRATV